MRREDQLKPIFIEMYSSSLAAQYLFFHSSKSEKQQKNVQNEHARKSYKNEYKLLKMKRNNCHGMHSAQLNCFVVHFDVRE